MSYSATGDESSLFYAKWLVRRILYLQNKNGGTVGETVGWHNIPPWQEAEVAIAAFELHKETGEEALLDIMGSWLEWVWHEAYIPGKGMPHRFRRGADIKKKEAFEYHWYPGVAAPLCYAALGDPKARDMTVEWAEAPLAYIKRGEFMNHPVGQPASYVLNYLDKKKQDIVPPEAVSDLSAAFSKPDSSIVLNWTAPLDKGRHSRGTAKKYWIKISDKPIVDHPRFPADLGLKKGFYHADNVKGEPVPGEAGHRQVFNLKKLSPHGAYGAEADFNVSDLEKGAYYLAIRSWDHAGNLSGLSNNAKVLVK